MVETPSDPDEIPTAESSGWRPVSQPESGITEGYYSSSGSDIAGNWDASESTGREPIAGANPFAASVAGPSAIVTPASIRQGLATTRFGLNIVFYAGIGVAILASIHRCIRLASYLAQNSADIGTAASLQSFGFMTGIIVFLVAVGVFTGQCFCASTPDSVGGRRWVLSSITLTVLAVLSSVAYYLLLYGWYLVQPPEESFSSSQVVLPATQLLRDGIFLAAELAFVWFLRHLARYMKLEGWATYATWYAVATALIAVVLGGLSVVQSISSVAGSEQQIGTAFVAAQAGLLVVSLVSSICYLVLVSGISRNLAKLEDRDSVPLAQASLPTAEIAAP